MKYTKMKTKYIILLFWILALNFAVSAQKTNTDNKSDAKKETTASHSSVEPQKKRYVLGFAKPEQMFLLLEGKWIFADMTCDEPYTVTVSADRKSIKFQYAKPQKWEDGTEHDSFVYNVLEVGKYYIRTQIDGEKRKTEDDSIVQWDFMFFSTDEFVWHRTDWEGLGSTKSITRCDDGVKRSISKPAKSE
jgi:hypothetical protein